MTHHVFGPFCAFLSVLLFGATVRTRQEIQCFPYEGFSLTRPSGLGQSLSQDVRVSVCVSDVQAQCIFCLKE